MGQKSATVAARVTPQVKRCVIEEAAKKEHTESQVVEAALRARYAKKLRALERAAVPTGPEAA